MKCDICGYNKKDLISCKECNQSFCEECGDKKRELCEHCIQFEENQRAVEQPENT